MSSDGIQIPSASVTKSVPQTVVVQQTIVYSQIVPTTCEFEYQTGRWMFRIALFDADGANRKDTYAEVSKAQIEAAIGKTWQESSTKEYFDAVMALAISAAREAAVR
jgi:hypothetical protein